MKREGVTEKKTKIRFQMVYTHENMSKKKREQWCEFFEEVKGLGKEDALDQTRFCEWFETEEAVSWFEAVAYCEQELVGYLRCLRNPKNETEWYIGDLHVREAYQRQGIATELYSKTLKRLEKYDACEQVVASISCNNQKTIGLHHKMGFADTGLRGDYLSPFHFYLDEDETIYKRMMRVSVSVRNTEWAAEQLLSLWTQYEEEKHVENPEGSGERLKAFLERNVSETYLGVEMIWCGRRLVGFRCEKENVEYGLCKQ